MLTQERQSLIEDYVNQHELCRVSELCDLTATSESTIRRDLIQMEKNGILKRVHGGAQSVKHFSRDVSQNVRFSLNHDAKITIARYAVQNFVRPGDNVFIDAGTTTYEMVPFLAEVANVKIITNGVETALCSLNHGINTILIGGEVKDDTHAVIGQTALSQIKAMNFSAILTDNSKIGERNFAVFANTSDVIVVTDQLKPGQKRSLPVGIELEEAK